MKNNKNLYILEKTFYIMAKTQFFYYDVDILPKENQTFDLLNKLKEIKKEKQKNKYRN